MPDLGWEEKLEYCDLVVFPGVSAIARDQAKVFEGYLKGGGRILAFEPLAERDENYNRADGLFDAGDSPRFRLVGDWDQSLGNDLWDRKPNDSIVQNVSETLAGLYPMEERQVSGDIPAETSVNIWEDRDRRFLAAHFVNYAWDVEGDAVVPLEDLGFGIDIPEACAGYRPVLVTPDLEEVRPLEAVERAGRTWVTIPRLEVFAVVVWGDWEAIQARTDYAEAMNLGIRLTRLGEDLPSRWWEALGKDRNRGRNARVQARLSDWGARISAVEDAYLSERGQGAR